jgi:hypothetical protein
MLATICFKLVRITLSAVVSFPLFENGGKLSTGNGASTRLSVKY